MQPRETRILSPCVPEVTPGIILEATPTSANLPTVAQPSLGVVSLSQSGGHYRSALVMLFSANT